MAGKKTALIAASAALGISALLAPTAMAANSTAAKMLTKSEVPSVFGKAKNYDFNTTNPDKKIVPCSDFSGKALYSQRAPLTQPAVDIETKNGNAYTSVSERVFQYSSAKAAAAAYTTLFNGSKACAGTTSGQNGTDASSKISETYVVGSQPGAEFQNFYVSNQSVFTNPDPKYSGKTSSFTLYSQAGNAVIATTAYVNPQDKFTPAEITAVSDLGVNLSAKWIK